MKTLSYLFILVAVFFALMAGLATSEEMALTGFGGMILFGGLGIYIATRE